MAKEIAVVNKAFTEKNRKQITDIAEKYGYKAAFFDRNRDAIPHLSHAEIVYGFGRELAEAAPELKWFCSLSAGVDVYLPSPVFQREDVILTNSSGVYGVTLAEHTLMVTLELLRRQMEYMQIVRERGWVRNLSIQSIKDSRVTVLGTGDLGREIAKRVKIFEPKRLTGVNRRGICNEPAFDSILLQSEVEQVLPETDILIMCLPGTRETDHFMNAQRLALLPAHAVLINVGRGNSLDQYALAKLLEQEKLAAAALDVFEREPLPKDDPLWSCKNLLITPHIAGNMSLRYTVDRGCDLFCEDLENYCNGRPLKRLIDITIGY